MVRFQKRHIIANLSVGNPTEDAHECKLVSAREMNDALTISVLTMKTFTSTNAL